MKLGERGTVTVNETTKDVRERNKNKKREMENRW